MYTKRKSIYTLVHNCICRGFVPKKQTVFIILIQLPDLWCLIKHLQAFIIWKQELQFQGKQYIYLPKTLVEITDLATKISIPLALKIYNIKSSHKRIQGTDKKLFTCQVLLCHAFHQSELPLYLKGRRTMCEIPRQVYKPLNNIQVLWKEEYMK